MGTIDKMGSQQIQEKAFTRWISELLKEDGMHIDDMFKDLKDGLVLIHLVEKLQGESVGKYSKTPHVPYAKLENVGIALNFLKEKGIKTVNIGPEDIHRGQPVATMGLIWTLMYHYGIRDGKNELLEWVRSKIPEYDIKNFTKDWNDGKALNALIEALEPGACPNHRDLGDDKVKNCQDGIDRCHDIRGVPKLLDGKDLANPRVNEKTVMPYIAAIRDPSAFGGKRPDPKKAGEDAANSYAYGPGLQQGVVNQDSPFTVQTPPNTKDKLDIKVFGPDGNPLPASGVKITDEGNGKHGVVYNPKKPGTYKIHVTLGGHHIPGSVFTVVVTEEESLGGEGKVLVFFSTTSSSNKGRSDVFNLQRLLEAKKVHLRPDFQPWIPVDIMEREDREAVFRKAGTRALPIVYVDDKYVGDYDEVNRLEEEGKLDTILRYNPNIKW